MRLNRPRVLCHDTGTPEYGIVSPINEHGLFSLVLLPFGEKKLTASFSSHSYLVSPPAKQAIVLYCGWHSPHEPPSFIACLPF